MEADPILLVRLGRHKDGLVDIRIELFALGRGVEALEAVFLQRGDEDAVGHLDAVVQRDQVLVVGLELLGGDGAEGAVEVVDGLDKVAGEALDGEVLCALDFSFCAFLEIAEVGD